MPASGPVAGEASQDGGDAASQSFGDVLARRVLERESQIVLGLDPHPAMLWPAGRGASVTAGSSGALVDLAAVAGTPGERVSGNRAPVDQAPADRAPALRAAAAVLEHCRALIDAVAPACVAIKPQLACFERLGVPGWSVLRAVNEHARANGLLVLADGKRGDISVTAEAYGQALFGGLETAHGRVEGLGADMSTVNPLMGRDAITPFVEAARVYGGGVLVLVRTSNPGAADVEDLELAGGGTVWEAIARIVSELGAPGVGEAGLSDVGAVVGATQPQHLARARELMPNTVFLLPGVGAQGGRVEDLAPAFAPGRAGGLITASRSIANAHQATHASASGASHAAAARAEAERLRALTWALT